jgi:hypothetical protein
VKFSELIEHVRAWLEREERVSYRALKLEFDLTEDVLDALKGELVVRYITTPRNVPQYRS